MRFGTGIAGAVAVHAAIGAVLAARTTERPTVPRPLVEGPTPLAAPAASTAIVEIVLLDELPVPQHARTPRPPRVTRLEPSNAIASVASTALMPRRRSGPRLRIPEDTWNAPILRKPEPAAPGLQLDGRSYEAATFTIDVEEDGGVHLRDRANLQNAIRLPTKKDIGNALQAWYDGPKGPEIETHPEDDDRPIMNPTGSIGVTILTFDVTDWAMRSRGHDPYASAKLEMLDATRDQRVALGTKHRREQLARSAEMMRDNIARVWTTISDPAERKRALFELWDECAESGPDELVRAGARGRAIVVDFVRALPAASSEAFTPDDVERMNQTRRSR